MTNDLFRGGDRLPVAEEFYTLQGEGFHSGKAAYFVRLGGCDIGCRWCDAKETWNPRLFPPVEIAGTVSRAASFPAMAVVVTGGEPTQYPLEKFTTALHNEGVEIFLETSGAYPFTGSFDWVCLSPKRQQPPLPENFALADELKVIVEGPDDLLWAEECAAKTGGACWLYLQPEWSRYEEVIPLVAEYAKANPRWIVSLQTHKFMHIP